MIVAAGIDWTLVVVAAITAVPATISALLVGGVRRSLRTPSGDTIGQVAERTHDLAAVSTMALGSVTTAQPMEDSARRLNASPGSPVKVNGGIVLPTEKPSP